MTTTIEFNNVKEELLEQILDKPWNQLSQDDLLTISRQLENAFVYKTRNLNKQELLINQAVNLITSTEYYKPYEQRTLVEFTVDHILEWLDENENSNLELSSNNVLDTYLTNGTLTFNRQKSINYIHAFWDDFIESDILEMEHEAVFENPERFLLSQVYYMANRILGELSERNLSKTECKELLTQMSLEDLEELVY